MDDGWFDFKLKMKSIIVLKILTEICSKSKIGLGPIAGLEFLSQ